MTDWKDGAPRLDREVVEAEVQVALAHVRLFEDASGFGSWDLDLASGAVRLSPSACALQGLPYPPPPGAGSLEGWLSRVHPDDCAQALAAMEATVREATPLRHEFRVRRPGGGWRWLEGRGRRLDAPDGTPLRLVGVDMDIDARKQAEARSSLVLREVEHRAKNAISAAQAVVRLTRAEDPRDFVRAVEQRLAALGRAHARLSSMPPGDGVELGPLAQGEVAPYAQGRRVRLRGPPVRLAPAAVQPLAMALHELATNAAKHGALSVEDGRIALRWRCRQDGRLLLSWREAGGPPPVAPPTRRGFGLSLLEALLHGQLGGTLRLDWGGRGLGVVACLPPACLAEDG